MKIGYAEENLTYDLDTGRNFRLNALTQERQAKAIDWNFDAFFELLDFNAAHRLLCFRLSAHFIPFAAHPQCAVDWATAYSAHFETVGRFVRDHEMRLCVLTPNLMLNSPRTRVAAQARADLIAICQQFDLMRIDHSHRVLLSLGGVFGDKKRSIQRFIDSYLSLPRQTQERIALINDDDYTIIDCMRIREQIAAVEGAVPPPVAFNLREHLENHGGDPMIEAFIKAYYTWHGLNALPIVLYAPEETPDRNVTALIPGDFIAFLQVLRGYNFDLIIEAPDREHSAIRALELAAQIHPAARLS
jgi:UV DNA damage endonuclease